MRRMLLRGEIYWSINNDLYNNKLRDCDKMIQEKS